MALSDLEVFDKENYTARRELLDYNVNVMNEISRGGLILSSGYLQGDFETESFWRRINGLVKRRNPYGTGALAVKELTMDTWTKVKVAGGSYPVNLEPSMLDWIAQDPAAAAARVMQQIVEDDIADRVKVAISVFVAAVGQNSNLVHDGTSGTMSLSALATGASKLGDQFGRIACWVMHSKVWFDIYQANLANANDLFRIGDVVIWRDPLGIPVVITDNPALVYTSGGTKYRTLGLQAGAVTIEDCGTFRSVTQTSVGQENIGTLHQTEWTWALGVRGYAWDTSAGGAAPNDAALFTASNWDKVATSDKDLPGVLILSQ